jgi:hypothetical protein
LGKPADFKLMMVEDGNEAIAALNRTLHPEFGFIVRSK